jgi:exodeoxyribonuclease V alpha subunit
MTLVSEPEMWDVSVARLAGGSLRRFNDAGILAPADVHVARRLAGLGHAMDEDVLLGVALATRAPRLGHVCVDLATIRQTASSDTDSAVDLDALPWPEPAGWLAAMAASPLVGEDRPLHLSDTNLYLDRLWRDECLVAAALEARAVPADDVNEALLKSGLAALFPEGLGRHFDPEHLQPIAAAAAVLRRLSVIAGGPGTGKTTIVARLLALLDRDAVESGRPAPRIALTAPTGKAAARLEEAVRAEAEQLAADDGTRRRLLALRGTTIHRLLGFDPTTRTRFRHNAKQHLRHDVVVVDETSMVSLSLMARLLEALRPDTRLVLLGDPEQLASVEAGAVLGDVAGPASTRICMDDSVRTRIEAVTGYRVSGGGPQAGHSAVGDGVVALHHVHRNEGAIVALARAIQLGEAEAVLAVLRQGGNVEWVEPPAGQPILDHVDVLRALSVDSGRAAIEAARAGDAPAALKALRAFRLLCAHRRGPDGVATWTRHIEAWLTAGVEGFSTGTEWYVGRPLIVTENDHLLQLFNGDVGVVVRGEARPMVAAFERGGNDKPITVSPTRLAAVDTVYAMTVHKSQGSQFETVGVVLPEPESRILTRELLYTAVTRAQDRLILVGSETSVRTAVDRPIARASGLRRALWGAAGSSDADPAEHGI